MTCPKCKKESSCGCKSCNKKENKYKRNIMKKEMIKCPYCLEESSYDVWLDEEYKLKNKNV